MEKQSLKVLLLQIRIDPRIKIQEKESFCKYSGFESHQIDVLDVFEVGEFSEDVLKGYDALYIGGTSESNVLMPESNLFLPSCYKLINYCVQSKFPVFASCFGFQMAIVAFGGEILHQEKDFEMGTYQISLNQSAKEDLLFKDTEDNFFAVSVHKQKAVELPETCESLAYTKECIHAFKVKEAPFWAFQFHPEVNKDNLVERLGIYKKQYTDDIDHFEEVIRDCEETPESALLVKKFVDRVLL